MPDGDLGGTPGWRERLAAIVSGLLACAPNETTALLRIGDYSRTVRTDDLAALAAAAPSPQEGGGGARISADVSPDPAWRDSPSGAPAWQHVDPEADGFHVALPQTTTSGSCMFCGRRIVSTSAPPAGVQVDRPEFTVADLVTETRSLLDAITTFAAHNVGTEDHPIIDAANRVRCRLDFGKFLPPAAGVQVDREALEVGIERFFADHGAEQCHHVLSVLSQRMRSECPMCIAAALAPLLGSPGETLAERTDVSGLDRRIRWSVVTPDLSALADALEQRAEVQLIGSRPTQRDLARSLAAVLRTVADEHTPFSDDDPDGDRPICGHRDGSDAYWPCSEVRDVLAAVSALLPLILAPEGTP